MKKYKVMAWMIVIIKNVFFIPVYITGGFAGVNLKGYISLYKYINQEKGCCDHFVYNINILRFLIEFIILGLIVFLIYLLVKKILKNNKY